MTNINTILDRAGILRDEVREVFSRNDLPEKKYEDSRLDGDYIDFWWHSVSPEIYLDDVTIVIEKTHGCCQGTNIIIWWWDGHPGFLPPGGKWGGINLPVETLAEIRRVSAILSDRGISPTKMYNLLPAELRALAARKPDIRDKLIELHGVECPYLPPMEEWEGEGYLPKEVLEAKIQKAGINPEPFIHKIFSPPPENS